MTQDKQAEIEYFDKLASKKSMWLSIEIPRLLIMVVEKI